MTTTYTVQYRRKRAGITDYRQRLKLLQSRLPRLVVRKTSHAIIAQLVAYSPQGDRVLVGVHSCQLRKYGWQFSTKNLPSAYLTGFLLAHKAKSKKITDAVLDIGLQVSVSGSRIYAVLKGALDGGISGIMHSPECLPSATRLSGKHIVDYVPRAANTQFVRYKKESLEVNSLSSLITRVKEAIQKHP